MVPNNTDTEEALQAEVSHLLTRLSDDRHLTFDGAKEVAGRLGALCSGENVNALVRRLYAALLNAPCVDVPWADGGTDAQFEANCAQVDARKRAVVTAAKDAWNAAQPDYDPALAGLSSRAIEMLRSNTGDIDQRITALEWQVHGWFDYGTIVRLNAYPGDGKTFVLLDLAACIATGSDFHGTPVKQGTVVYVVAEKPEDFKVRKAAWEAEHNGGIEIPEDDFHVWSRNIPQVADAEDWAAFILVCKLWGADIVVFDTQDRITEGMNEQQGLRPLSDACLALKRDTGATVLLAHHLGLKGTHGAGDSSVFRNLSTEVYLTKVRRANGTKIITAHNKKQSSHDEFADVSFAITPAHGSAVLTPTANPRRAAADETDETVAEDVADVVVPDELAAAYSGRFRTGGGDSVAMRLAQLYLSDASRDYSQTEALRAIGIVKEDSGFGTGRKAWATLRDDKWITDDGGYRWNLDR